MTEIVPLQAIPAQTVRVQLSEQDVVLSVYQKSTGLYIDIQINGEVIIRGELCRDRVILVRQEYLGFIGDLTFIDTEGRDDPYYNGLGGRFKLFYFTDEDVT